MITEKMLKGGDIDMNSVQSCADTFKGALKNTILNQELVFRTQVYELHRLYRIQKTLTNEFKWKEFDSYTLTKGSSQSTSFTPNNLAEYNIIGEEIPFSSAVAVSEASKLQSFHMSAMDEYNNISSGHGCIRQYVPAKQMRPTKQEYSEKQQQNVQHNLWYGLTDFTQRPLDLRLPADEFISHATNYFPEKGNLWNSFDASGRNKNSLQIEKISELSDIKLSLSLTNEIGKKSEDGKRTCHIPYDVVDLEDPPLSLSNNDACSAFASRLAASSSEAAKRDLTHGITESGSLGFCPSYGKKAPYSSGFNTQKIETPNTDCFNKNQLSLSCEPLHLDLNKVIEDMSSCLSNNSMELNSVSGFSGVSRKVDLQFPVNASLAPSSSISPNTNHSIENPEFPPREDHLYFSLVNGDGSRENLTEEDAESKENIDSNTDFIDLETVPGHTFDVGEDPCNPGSDPKNESVGSQSKLSDRILGDGDKMDAMTVEDHKLSGSCKSDSNTDDHSISNRTMQSGIECGESHFSTSDESRNDSLGSRVKEASLGDLDQRSSDSRESSNQYIDKRGQSEVDESVQKAAESLVFISMKSQVCPEDVLMRANSKEFNNADSSKPEYSSESFESIALKLSESSSNDYAMSSKTFQVCESEKRDFGYKLKRGTRMRDFQKDILPGLSTLARREICEDINIMESVIRSREYKKMRSKMNGGENWSKTTRSRRSRANYRRRYYA
ncbi:hypothetical protein Nepgr_024607 [Nepenthes gracilis]|uniref:Uncharacterized protein n=1 Tax=Nepenthes gracilis TaxID=150966 RepID=A0AAD3T4V1_NEPGR|nr:hypothetical protein Nepgr_024607 [Nepenthes gracilis]